MEYKPKSIYCPICKRKVGKWDGRSTVNVIVAGCKKCRKKIVYHVDTGQTKLSKIPPRNTSSGMTFI